MLVGAVLPPPPPDPGAHPDMTTRLGVVFIVVGAALLAVRAFGALGGASDIAAALCIVVGALGVAIDGEAADRGAD